MTDETLKENTTHGKAERACKQCGAAFVARVGKQVCCSSGCGKIYRNGVQSDYRKSLRSGRICVTCGSQVSDNMKSGAKYCTNECAETARRKRRHPERQNAKCKCCGVTVVHQRVGGPKIYCSMTCKEIIRNKSEARRKWKASDYGAEVAREAKRRYRNSIHGRAAEADYNEAYRADGRHKEAKGKYRASKATCPVWCLDNVMRSSVWRAVKNVGAVKLSRTFTMLGYTPQDLADHLERQFVKGMTWDNRHKWHIDHIVPISTAETEADVIALNQLSNLRPIWAKDNLAKSDKRTHLI